MKCPVCGGQMALDPIGGYWCQNPSCEHVMSHSDIEREESQNVGSWERSVAEQHNLHSSWLKPFDRLTHGSKCFCCNKMRSDGHYVTDTVFCVFCSVACRNNKGCQSQAA